MKKDQLFVFFTIIKLIKVLHKDTIICTITANFTNTVMQIQTNCLLRNLVVDSRQQYALYLKTTQGTIEQYDGKNTDAYTNFRMASVTKQFVAFSVLSLIDAKHMGIHTKLSQIFDDIPEYMKNITIRHLLTHTSGIMDYEDRQKIGRKQITDTEVFEYLKTLHRGYFRPGTKYRYSNGGYIILGKVIEKLSGKKLANFVHDTILSPAGMHESVIYTQGVSVIKNRAYGHKLINKNKLIIYDQGPDTATQGDGGLYSSIHDLKKYLSFIQSSKTAKKMFVSKTLPNGKSIEYGYGLRIKKYKNYKIIYHCGETCGTNTIIGFIPRLKIEFAFMTALDGIDTEIFFKNLVRCL